jgi:acyl-CoA thioester hydrolase
MEQDRTQNPANDESPRASPPQRAAIFLSIFEHRSGGTGWPGKRPTRRIDRFSLAIMIEQTLAIRVRYPEADAMGYLHHSRYLQYFEMGRIELLRAAGHSYADLERDGVFFVVVKAEVKYKSPARFDEELELTTRIARQTPVRIEHVYELRRGATLLAEGATTIACVNRAGELQAIPDRLVES